MSLEVFSTGHLTWTASFVSSGACEGGGADGWAVRVPCSRKDLRTFFGGFLSMVSIYSSFKRQVFSATGQG